GFRIVFDVRKTGADDEQCIALFHGIVGGLGAKKANTAGSVRAGVGHTRLSQERLDNRSGEQLRDLLQFLSAAERATARENDNLFPLVQDLSGSLEVVL